MSTDVVIEKKTTNSRKVQEPKKYKVVICNDDVTPIEFVVAMLVAVFKKSQQDAYDLTMEVHNQGRAVAGIYNYEIAEQKALDGINLARSHGYPLLIKVEQE